MNRSQESSDHHPGLGGCSKHSNAGAASSAPFQHGVVLDIVNHATRDYDAVSPLTLASPGHQYQTVQANTHCSSGSPKWPSAAAQNLLPATSALNLRLFNPNNQPAIIASATLASLSKAAEKCSTG